MIRKEQHAPADLLTDITTPSTPQPAPVAEGVTHSNQLADDRRHRGHLLAAMREQVPLAILVAAYVATAIAVFASRQGWQSVWAFAYAIPDALLFAGYQVFPVMALVAFYYRERAERIAERPLGVVSSWRSGWALARRGAFGTPALLRLGVTIALIAAFHAVFPVWKDRIPTLMGQVYDLQLVQVERWLHGGKLPTELLAPLTTSEWIVRLLDLLYVFPWFPLTFFVPVVLAWAPSSPYRNHCLLSFLATWILLGSLLATAGASLGPCYLEYITTDIPDAYASLADRLDGWHARFPLFAVRAQRLLVEQSGKGAFGGGISAFPSLHVAIATWFALAARGWRPKVSRALWCYAFLVLLGSVVLNWHYAIDGYTGMLGAVLIWIATGRLLMKGENGPLTVPSSD